MNTSCIKEQKFVFADQSIAEAIFATLVNEHRLGDYKLVSGAAIETEDRYFDTCARSLQQNGASLRVRGSSTGASVVQFKRAAGDASDDMEYLTLESVHAAEPHSEGIHLSDEIGTALALLGVSGDLKLLGAVKTARRAVSVQKCGERVAELFLDRFTVMRADKVGEATGQEIEIKGSDQNELLYLGQCLSNWFGLIRVTSSKIDRHFPLPQPASRLLLDMDPGVDDALALLYLFAHQNGPSVEAISTVGGNVSVRQCAKNAYRICRWAVDHGFVSQIPPIGTGIDLNAGRSSAANVHGRDGLGDVDWGAIDLDAETQQFADAIELQRDVLFANPGEVTVVATGPCSNLAELIRRYPEALAAAREVIVMGGSFFDCGNRGPQAEFNVHSDSAAARSLLSYCRQLLPNGPKSFRERVPLTFVGLDVTHRTILERRMLKGLKSSVAGLAAGISSKYMDFYRTVLGIDGCPLHDPLAVGAALHPEFVVRQSYHVEIVSTPEVPETDGITIADHRPCALFKDRFKEVTQVCVSVNGEAFLADFRQCMDRNL